MKLKNIRLFSPKGASSPHLNLNPRSLSQGRGLLAFPLWRVRENRGRRREKQFPICVKRRPTHLGKWSEEGIFGVSFSPEPIFRSPVSSSSAPRQQWDDSWEKCSSPFFHFGHFRPKKKNKICRGLGDLSSYFFLVIFFVHYVFHYLTFLVLNPIPWWWIICLGSMAPPPSPYGETRGREKEWHTGIYWAGRKEPLLPLLLFPFSPSTSDKISPSLNSVENGGKKEREGLYTRKWARLPTPCVSDWQAERRFSRQMGRNETLKINLFAFNSLI